MKTRQSMQKARKKLLVLMFTEMIEMPVIVPETEKRQIFDNFGDTGVDAHNMIEMLVTVPDIESFNI